MLRQLMDRTTMPKELADELLSSAPSLWLASDGEGDLASDLALCHPPLAPREVRARVARAGPSRWRLTVVAHNRRGLLADTAGLLAQEGLSIASASAVTWEHLDLALHAVCLPGAPPGAVTLERLGSRLRAAAEGDRPDVRFDPEGPAQVRIVGEAGGDAIVTVNAPDQFGLLWAICRWFADHGGDIQAAGVSGDAIVHDVFIVRDCPNVTALERLLNG
jgi:predicted amino acid-binding ACT domain protein